MIIQTHARARSRHPHFPRLRRPQATTATPLAVLVAVIAAMPCAAHHSFANFDMARTLTLRGTVKELQWTNPHCYVQLLVSGARGPVEWSLEMNSPLASYRAGWRPHSVSPGDRVTVVINPSKDGTLSGRLASATDANGRTLGSSLPAGPPTRPTKPKGPAQ